MSELAQRLVKITPSPRQIAWQKLEFTAFLHFGVNTFTDREWGTGQESPAIFAPDALDTDQWCRSLAAAGIRACILTAKHHDGFCLWDTKSTDYSVMHSPYGRDIVAQFAQSCRRYGLCMGLYLSPWDRHESCYGEGRAYNDFFCAQLTELLTGYGELYALWFDGACGEGKNGRKQSYDWERYYALIRKHQPNAVISVCGPDVRWCGNEQGQCRPSEWSVVPAWLSEYEKIHEISQQSDDAGFRERELTSSHVDLGSREMLKDTQALMWYPAEVNVSIRPGWFYHASEDGQLKTLGTLVDMFEKSVGGNGVFLLNVPPDRHGRIHAADVLRLEELGREIAKRYGKEADLHARATSDDETDGPAQAVLEDNEQYWKPRDGKEAASLALSWEVPASISAVVLQEQIALSQRIEAFRITCPAQEGERVLYEGTTVGYKKICRFPPVKINRITIEILNSRVAPTLQRVCLYP